MNMLQLFGAISVVLIVVGMVPVQNAITIGIIAAIIIFRRRELARK